MRTSTASIWVSFACAFLFLTVFMACEDVNPLSKSLADEPDSTAVISGVTRTVYEFTASDAVKTVDQILMFDIPVLTNGKDLPMVQVYSTNQSIEVGIEVELFATNIRFGMINNLLVIQPCENCDGDHTYKVVVIQ